MMLPRGGLSLTATVELDELEMILLYQTFPFSGGWLLMCTVIYLYTPGGGRWTSGLPSFSIISVAR